MYHNSQDIDYRSPFGAVKTSSEVILRIKAEDAISAKLRIWEDETGEKIFSMKQVDDIFETKIKLPDNECIIWYYFILERNNGEVVYYGNNELRLGGMGKEYNYEPDSYQITVYKETKCPKWYKDSIVYQIFPDKFNRGSDFEKRKEEFNKKSNWNGQNAFIEEDFNKDPYYIKNEKGEVTCWPFSGGTLKGIEEKIQYLKSIGVSCIYLNPIFEARSNHRYDTANYMKIDPLLGDDKSFESLCKVAKENDISIILDGVFSHTGADSIYFDKYGNYERISEGKSKGAYAHEDSPYRSWYRFNESECGYESWWGVKDLPNVEETNKAFEEHICGEKGVLKKWIRLGAKGFRLDVADELPDSFIEKIRKSIKEESEDNLLIGEVWEDASNKHSYGSLRKYLLGKELDATMNYPFRDIMLSFIMGDIDSDLVLKKYNSLRENYPKEAFFGAFNLIGSHDRQRALTVLGGANNLIVDENADFKLDGNLYALARFRLKLLATLQYTMPGVPVIYYGDEVGIEGLADPFNRKSYPWGCEDEDIKYHYRMLGIIYSEHSVLKDGDFKPFTLDKDVYGFIRSSKEEDIVVIVNRNIDEYKNFKIPISKECEEDGIVKNILSKEIQYGLELLTSREEKIEKGTLDLSLAPIGMKVILLKKNRPIAFKRDRSAGVILAISSLPSAKINEEAYKFVDSLVESGFKLWQLLPINPRGYGNSPYFSPAVFAGNPNLVDLGFAQKNGFIRKVNAQKKGETAYNIDGIKYIVCEKYKNDFKKFQEENTYWLDDYLLFTALKEKNNNKGWLEWPEDDKDRINLKKKKNELKEDISKNMFLQFVFKMCWDKVHKYANEKGITIIGDLPIYVSNNSADIWSHREEFQVDSEGHLLTKAGVPPDFFAQEGQDWGNPLYNWKAMRKNGYKWWMNRMKHASEMFDAVRIDHFRSFAAYFSIPANRKPKEGNWVIGEGMHFFNKVKETIGDFPIIAEDLGQLDNSVYNLIDLTGFPGMHIYQFSSDDMKNMPPEEMQKRVFYSGTHDNQTLKGWVSSFVNKGDVADFQDENHGNTYEKEGQIKKEIDNIIEFLMSSQCPWVIFQLQDILGLGDEARINVPSSVGDNWKWRVDLSMFNDEIKSKFNNIIKANNR